jgi:hypothetical protein
MNRTPYPISQTLAREEIRAYGCVQGAVGAAPVIPSTVTSGTSSIGWMSALDNFISGVAADLVRTGAGVYTVKLKDNIPVILDIIPTLWGADGKQVQMTDYNPTTRVLSFKTFTSAGIAADIVATDFIRFVIIGKLVVENA